MDTINIEDKTSNEENENSNIDIGNNDEINNNIFVANIDRQVLFDRFLTYRRRMARLGAIQSIYLYNMKDKIRVVAQKNDLFNKNKDKNEELFKNDALTLCQEVIYFYRNVFFTQQEYGWTKKNKKVDESFMYELVKTTLNNIGEINNYISSKLNEKWNLSKLDLTLYSIISCAIGELLIGYKIEKAVLSSEYTNIASDFFSGKEIGFINGITDKLYDEVLKKHPFCEKQN